MIRIDNLSFDEALENEAFAAICGGWGWVKRAYRKTRRYVKKGYRYAKRGFGFARTGLGYAKKYSGLGAVLEYKRRGETWFASKIAW